MKRLVWIAIAAAVTSRAADGQQTLTVTSTKDNTLYQSLAGSLSNGAGTYMFVGRNGSSELRRAVVAFDLSSSPIPAGAVVQTVQVQLVMNRTQAGTESVAMHRVTADWGEGTSVAAGQGGGGASATTNDATWIHRFYNTMNWATAGGDFVTAASATQNVGGNGTYTWGSTASLVADVQGWLTAPTTNFGWIFVGNESTDQTAKRFATREDATPANRPQLTITYTVPPMASVAVVGTGCVGAVSGQPLTLAAIGMPTIGNATFGLTISNGTPGAPAHLFHAIGLEPTPVMYGGCPVYLNIASLFAIAATGVSPIGPVPLDGTGSYTFFAPIANDPTLFGLVIDAQAIAIDNLGTGSTVTSNALTLTFGI